MPVELRLFGNPVGGVRRARSMLDRVIATQQEDGELAEAMGDLWAGAQRRMTRPELEGYTLALQQRANDVHTINAGFDGFSVQQKRLMEAATTPQDRAQLEGLDTQAKVARSYMLSNNPELQKLGRELSASLFTEQRNFATTNEAQERAGVAALGAQRWDRFKSTYDDLYRESTDFLDIQRAYGVLRSSYAGEGEPGNAADIAAINSLQRMIDPGVSVREGDVSLLQNLAGVPDWLITAANRVAKGGGRFTPQERAELVRVGDKIMAAANEKQTGTNARFRAVGEVGELPPAYLDRLSIPISDTGAGATGLNFGKPALEAGAAARDGRGGAIDLQTDSTARMVGESVQSGAATAAGQALDFLGGLTGLGGGARATDEYAPPKAPPPPPEYARDGTLRGVYVPPFLRSRGGK